MKFTSIIAAAFLSAAVVAAPAEQGYGQPTYSTAPAYTTKPTTTKPAYTTKPTTTKPTTTKPVYTTKPISTTKPTTTKSATPTPSPVCSGGQVPACCNPTDEKLSLGSIIGGLLDPGKCIPIVTPLLGSLLGYCGSNVPQCCDNNQSGLINLNVAQCVAIIL